MEMKKNFLGYNRKTEGFYRQFADENQIDCVQLALLDLLMNRGGAMTWTALLSELPFPRSLILENARMMEQDLILDLGQDAVSISDYGQFALGDFMETFQKELASRIGSLQEAESPCLMA